MVDIARKNIVWKFTNQRELTKSQFLDYFEKKIFRTIRQYNMLRDKSGRRIKLQKENSLNFIVLKNVLEKKFSVSVVASGSDVVSDNLSDVAESAFENVLDGNFDLLRLKPKNQPLYFLSDAEVSLYAKLSGLSGTVKNKKRNDHVQKLFATFMKKNPDLEHNVVNAMRQLE